MIATLVNFKNDLLFERLFELNLHIFIIIIFLLNKLNSSVILCSSVTRILASLSTMSIIRSVSCSTLFSMLVNSLTRKHSPTDRKTFPSAVISENKTTSLLYGNKTIQEERKGRKKGREIMKNQKKSTKRKEKQIFRNSRHARRSLGAVANSERLVVGPFHSTSAARISFAFLFLAMF